MASKRLTINLRLVNLNKKKRIPLNNLKKKVLPLLRNLDLSKRHGDLNIIFVDNKYIKQLNKKYKKRNYPTDVLCFDIGDLGADIFISTDMALTNSKKFETSFFYETTLYVVHGLLHLAGYKDSTPMERRVMERAQEKMLEE